MRAFPASRLSPLSCENDSASFTRRRCTNIFAAPTDADNSLRDLLCRQRERYVPPWCAWMWRGSIRAGRVTDWNEQMRSPVDFIHHRRAAYSGGAAKRRRPEHLACFGIVGVDRAVAAETEQQPAGSDDDAV